jgi:hypothetical protein
LLVFSQLGNCHPTTPGKSGQHSSQIDVPIHLLCFLICLCLLQTFVFAVPLPLRDRQLRLELYRTSSNTQRGRLVSMAHVSSIDMVEPHTLACCSARLRQLLLWMIHALLWCTS